jgi:hypothetical protein
VNSGLNLSNCISLVYLDARGSNFTSVTFAEGGMLQEAYLESPIAVTLKSLSFLKDDKLSIADYSKIKSLRIEDCPSINTLDFINKAINLESLRLIDISWTLEDSNLLKTLS